MKIQISLSSTVDEKLQSLLLRLTRDKKNIKSVKSENWGYGEPALHVVEKDRLSEGWGVLKALKLLGWQHMSNKGSSEYVAYMERPDKSFRVRVNEVPGSKYIIPEGKDWSS